MNRGPNSIMRRLVCLCLLLCPALAYAQLVLDPVEKQWRDQHPVVRYTVFPGLHPMEDVQDGKPTGIVPAYLEIIGRDAGVRFEYVATHSWDEAVELFKRGEIDVLPSVTEELAAGVAPGQVTLTLPYFSTPMIAISKADAPIVTTVAELAGKTVGLRKGVMMIDVPGVKVISYPTTASMLEGIRSGAIDYGVGGDAVYSPVVRSRYVGELGNAGFLDVKPLEARMLVLKRNAALSRILDKAIAQLTAEETDLLYLHWLEQVEYGAPNARSIWRYLGQEVVLLAGLLVALAIATVWATRARAAAKSNERAKARFLAMMSHEVRTPVNVMVGSIEAMHQTVLDGRQREIMQVVSAAADSLVDLLNDVLDLSKLEERQLKLAPTAVEPVHLLGEVVRLAKVQAESKGLSLDLRIQGFDPGISLLLDVTRVRQVLNNLLGNALKFTERGQIVVEAVLLDEHAQRYMTVTVSDTGIGIPVEHQAALFTPYVQADSSITRRYGGTGLGLSLCKTLVELMGGRIMLESRPGAGTKVSFRLPVDIASPAISPLPHNNRSTPAVAAMARVLIVDDVALNSVVLRDQLSTLSIASTAFEDAEAALAHLRHAQYDIVLLDSHMPGLDGYEAARRIKSDWTSPPPTIAISASTDSEHQLRCARAGFDGVLSKPIRTKDLIGVLELWGIEHKAPPNPAAAVSSHVPDFLAQLVSDWNGLRAGHAIRDMGAVAHHAHRIKGVALVFGVETLVEISSEIEVLALEGSEVPADLLARSEQWLRRSYPDINLEAPSSGQDSKYFDSQG